MYWGFGKIWAKLSAEDVARLDCCDSMLPHENVIRLLSLTNSTPSPCTKMGMVVLGEITLLSRVIGGTSLGSSFFSRLCQKLAHSLTAKSSAN